MKSTHVRLSLLAAALAGAAAIPATAAAEVSASAGVSSLYLFRGQDASNGAPQVFGGLEYATEVGAYAGVWGSSSGDYGQEVDLYAGFRGGEEFTYNIAYYDYAYPQSKGVNTGASYMADTDGDGIPDTSVPTIVPDNRSNDYEELMLGAGFMGISFEAWIGMGDTGGVVTNAKGENKNENNYFAVGYSFDKYGVKYGVTANDTPNTDYSHIDVSYKYNDNLSFTLSKVVDDDDKVEDDALFQVSYVLPLDLKAAK